MAYMKFEKKMLGGSDFFLDFLGPDLAKILGFGALRGQFWTIEIQKTPKLFRRPAGPQKGGPPPLNPRLIQVLKALGTKKICHFLFENGKNGKNQGSFSSSFHIYMTMPWSGEKLNKKNFDFFLGVIFWIFGPKMVQKLPKNGPEIQKMTPKKNQKKFLFIFSPDHGILYAMHNLVPEDIMGKKKSKKIQRQNFKLELCFECNLKL